MSWDAVENLRNTSGEPRAVFKVPMRFRLLDPITLQPLHESAEHVTYTSLRFDGGAAERYVKKLNYVLETEGVGPVLVYIARGIYYAGLPPPNIHSARSAPKAVKKPKDILAAMSRAFYRSYCARAAKHYSEQLKNGFAKRRSDIMAEARKLYLADACSALEDFKYTDNSPRRVSP